MKSLAPASNDGSSKTPSSPIQASSPSTSLLPSVQRAGLRMVHSSISALEALDKAVDDCSAANEREQRARTFQKNIRPAIDILRINSVAGSSYSMLGTSKSKDDFSAFPRPPACSELCSPRPLWMDMVERRQEAW
jgi:hypothetical protein